LFFCLLFSLCRQSIQQNLFHFDDYSLFLSLSLSLCSLLSFLFTCRQHRKTLIDYVRSFLFVLIVPLPSSIAVAKAVLYLTHTKTKSQSTSMMRMIIIRHVYLKIETRQSKKKISLACASFCFLTRKERKRNAASPTISTNSSYLRKENIFTFIAYYIFKFQNTSSSAL